MCRKNTSIEKAIGEYIVYCVGSGVCDARKRGRERVRGRERERDLKIESGPTTATTQQIPQALLISKLNKNRFAHNESNSLCKNT